MSAHADKTVNKLDIHHKENVDASNLGTRSQLLLPSIEAIYDSTTKAIEIVSDTDCEAIVFVYDQFGNIINTADSLNTIIYIQEAANSVLYIRIESYSWYATATITV